MFNFIFYIIFIIYNEKIILFRFFRGDQYLVFLSDHIFFLCFSIIILYFLIYENTGTFLFKIKIKIKIYFFHLKIIP